jgi:hypothetical protein
MLMKGANMQVNKCKEEHAEHCTEALKVFVIDTGSCIHVELCCDKCGARYVYDIYTLTEV